MATSTTFALLLLCTGWIVCEQRFLYFGYGSNLLARRLLINNPSAVFVGIARLQDYRLDFITYGTTWYGAAATIVPDPGEKVWGALWSLDTVHISSLDEQEGVDEGFYFPLYINATKPDGAVVTARTYQQTHNPPKLRQGETMPVDRQPSKTYLQVIVTGARECGIPPDYIRYLQRFPNNGRLASEEIRLQLGSPF